MMRLPIWLLVMTSFILFQGCQIAAKKQEENKDEEKKEQKIERIPVEVAPLDVGPIESTIKSTTHLEAEEEVKVLARTTNPAKEILVEEGDQVELGQVILVLDDNSQQINLSKAENEVKKAKLEFERQQSLFEKHLISDQDFSEIKYALMQKELALEDATRELEYTKVRAPITGTITARYIKVGDQINVNQHLFDIVDFNSIVARVYLPENQLQYMKIGQEARIHTTALGSQVFQGTVSRIAPIVDRKTGTVKVTVAVGDQPGLKPGMYIEVELILNTNDHALLIPKRALTYDGDQMYVFKLKDDRTVQRCLVQPRLMDKFNIEPQGGFEENEKIVIAGQSGLKDGSPIRLPEDPEEEPAEKTVAENKNG